MVPRYGWTGLSPITKVTTSASCWAAMHKQSACSWWSLMVSGGGGLQPPPVPPACIPWGLLQPCWVLHFTAAFWYIRGADK